MSIKPLGTAIATIGVNTREWVNGLTKAQKQMQSFAAGVQVNAFRISIAWAATAGMMVAMTMKIGSSFEREFTGVRKTVKGTEEEFASLRKELIETSKATTFSADELAILARKGGQLGIATQNLAQFTTTMSKLGLAAAELPAEEAAVGLSRLMAITGESQTNIDILASVLARLGDSFATNESRILNFASRISGLSKVAGITANDTLAMGAAFTATVPGVELVATQVSKSMAIFSNAVESGGERLKVLDEVVAHTGRGFKEQFKENAAQAVAEFLKGLDNVRVASGNAFVVLDKLKLTNQRAAQAFLAAAGASDQFKEALRIMNEEVGLARTAQGKLNKAFEEQMKTVSAKMDRFSNIMSAGFIALFDAFGKQIHFVVDTLVKLAEAFVFVAESIDKLPNIVKTLIVVVLGLTSALIASTLAAGAFASTWLGIKATMAQGATMLGMTATNGMSLATTFGSLQAGAAKMTYAHAALVPSLAKVSSGFAAALTAGLALGVFFATFTATKYIMEVTGATKALGDWLYEYDKSIGVANKGLDAQMKKSREALVFRAFQLQQEGKIQKQTINGWKHAEELIKKYNASLRDTNGVLGLTGKALEARLKEVAEIQKREELLAKASKMVGEEIEDTAKAQEIINRAIKLGLVDSEKTVETWKSGVTILENIGAHMKEIGASLKEAQQWDLTKGLAEKAGAATGQAKEQREAGNPFFAVNQDAEIALAAFKAAHEQGKSLQELTRQGILPELTQGQQEEINDWIQGLITPASTFEDNWVKSIKNVQKIMKMFGLDASSTLGTIVGGMAGISSSLFNEKGKFELGQGTWGAGDTGGTIQAGIGGAAGIIGATGSGSRGKRVAGGAMAGAAAGGQIMPGIGHAIGAAVGAVVGALRGRAVLGAIKKVAQAFGKEISEELAKQLVESSKELGSMQNAMAANLGDILEETGINEGNLTQSTQAFGNLIGMVENGTMSIGDATEQINKSFGIMVEYLETLGNKGSLEIGKLVRSQLQAGVVTDEVRQYFEEQASTLSESLAPALEYVSSLTDLTASEAKAFSGVIVAAWGAAAAQTGSFIEAVRQLGETFSSALSNIMDQLGPDGQKVVGPIAEIYNIISNNQGAFDAINGIVGGLDAMAKMGVLTGDTLAAMSEGVRASFERIVKETENETAALKASWPELVKLYDWYEQLGMDAPGWLNNLIGKGQELGLSMVIPMTATDALNEMVRLLGLMVEGLGLIPGKIDAIASSARKVEVPSGDGKFGDGVPGMATGGTIFANPPHGSLYVGGERENEYVVPESRLDEFAAQATGGVDGGSGYNVTVNVNAGNFLGTPDEFARTMQTNMTKWIRNNDGGLQSTIVDIASRG